MPAYDWIQNAFNAGEVSPRSRGRTDLELYKRALALCRNWMVLPQGPILMRGGSSLVAALASPSARLIDFRMSDAQDFLLVLLGGKLRIYSITGEAQAVDSQTVTQVNAVQNGVFDGNGGWTEDAKGSTILWDNGQLGLRVTDESGGTANHRPRVYQKITLPAPSTVRVKAQFIERQGEFIAHQSHQIKFGSAPDASDFLGIERQLYGGAGPTTIAVEDMAAAGAVLPAGDYYVTLSVGDIGSDTQVITAPCWFDNVEVIITSASPEAGYDIDIPWTDDQLADVQYVQETGTDRVIFVHPRVAPWSIQFSGYETESIAGGIIGSLFGGTRGGVWSYGDVTFTSPPVVDPDVTDSPAAWSEARGYPGVIEVYNGRVYYAGVPAERNRFWASRSGTAFDMRLKTGAGGAVLESDALDFKVAAKGAFRWLRGQRTLLAGTDQGELSISGSSGVITPSDILVREESAFGSAPVQAVNVGSMALWVSADRRRVRAASFDLQTDGWDSRDVTFSAEHMTRGLIKEMHHVRTPDGLVLLILDTGEVLACTFDPDEKVVAWWRIDVGAPVRSAAVSRGPSGAYLWLIVERGIAGASLERLPLFDDDSVQHLDGATQFIVSAPTTRLPLNGYIGNMARVIVNGALLGDYPVQLRPTGDTVDIDEELAVGDSVVVGLPFRATAKLLPPEGGNPAGTAQGQVIQQPLITLRLNDSARPLVNGQRAEDRSTAAPMDGPEPRHTEDVDVVNVSDGEIVIEQDLPFRTEVCAIFGRTSMGKV